VCYRFRALAPQVDGFQKARSSIGRPGQIRHYGSRGDGGGSPALAREVENSGERSERPTAECFALLFGDVAKKAGSRLTPAWARRDPSGGDASCACRDGTCAFRRA